GADNGNHLHAAQPCRRSRLCGCRPAGSPMMALLLSAKKNGVEGLPRRLMRSSSGACGAVIVILFVAMACLAPVVSPYDPLATDWGALRQAPSAAHWMGTDDLGRDVMTRVIWGSQASLLVGVFSIVLAMIVGVPLGLISGYLGGVVDGVLMRITDG